MSQAIYRLVSLSIMVEMAALAAPIDTYTFGTEPINGVLSGQPGATIGWGYTITNQSATDWLVTTGANAGLFMNGTPDGSLFDFPILAPGTTVTEFFDPLNAIGLYALTWDPSAPIGFVNSGVFTLSADWWNGDLFSAGTFIANASDLTASYSATVSAASTVPEAASSVLVATGMLFMVLARLKQRKGVT